MQTCMLAHWLAIWQDGKWTTRQLLAGSVNVRASEAHDVPSNLPPAALNLLCRRVEHAYVPPTPPHPLSWPPATPLPHCG
jgi:hypothetical protein